MVPTIFGIIIITFLLFNVVGGDPALLKLGKQARAASLEAFDIQRGYDKPLFFGSWGKTRAYSEIDFSQSAGHWTVVSGAVHNLEQRRLVLSGDEVAIPVAFPLESGKLYRWTGKYRLDGKARLVVGNKEGELAACDLRGSDTKLKTFSLEFRTGKEAASLKSRFFVEKGNVELASLRLGKKTSHFFDSQFFFYLGQLIRGDFGTSHETNQKVSSMILDGVLPSLALTVPMFLAGVIVSISLALICAFYRETLVDRLFVIISVILMSVHSLVWIVLGQYLLGYKSGIFPVWGYESWYHLALPCLIGVLTGLGENLRFYRTVMLDEMYRDYVRTAFAKGVSKSGVLFRHILKNAMIPILTSVVMAIPFLYSGSLLLETFFGIPGLGRMGVMGINTADVDVVRTLVFVAAVLYVVANLLTDICYALVDPRVRMK